MTRPPHPLNPIHWIKRMLQAISDWLKPPQKVETNPEATAPIEPPGINVSALAANMKLQRKGEHDGKRETPPTESQGLNQTEVEISNYIAMKFTEWQAHIRYKVNELNTKIQQLSQKLLSSNYNALANIISTNAVGSIHSKEVNAQAHIKTQQEIVNERQEKLTDLKQRMNIKTLPKEVPNVPLHWLALLAILCLETVLNGNFLGLRSAGGLIEGTTTALAIAFFNVFLGYIAGAYCWIYLRHWKHWIKALNTLALLSILTAVITVNLAAGHYRDILNQALQVETNLLNITIDAFKSFTKDPTGIQDIMSWALAAVGIICAICATIGAHMMRDPYPHYAKTHERAEIAQEDLNAIREQHLKELEEIYKNSLQKLSDLTKTAANPALIQQEINNLQTELQNLRNKDIQSRQDLEKAGNDLFSIYRNANKIHRQTPAPQHWNSSFKINNPTPVYTPPSTTNTTTGISPQNIAINNHTQTIKTAYQKALKTLSP